MKKILSLIAFVLLVAVQTASAAVVKSYATSKDGRFELRCEYDTETDEFEIFMTSINWEAYGKDMVIPYRVGAKFEDYDGKGGTKEDDEFTYLLDEYCTLDMVSHKNEIESITINCRGKVPDGFAMSDPNFSHAEPSALKSVKIGSYITEIGKEAFAYNENLTEIDIKSVETIGDRAFAAAYEDDMMGGKWYGSIKEARMDKATEIGVEAFIGQGELEKVLFNYDEGYTIYRDAFKDCGIKEMALSSNASGYELTQSPFIGCPLETVSMFSINGAEGRIIQVAPYLFAGVSSAFDFKYQPGTSTFKVGQYESVLFFDHCFYNSGIKSIEWYDGWTIDVISPATPSISIGESAFASTSNLKEFEMPDETAGDVDILNEAFRYSGIESVNLAKNNHLRKIGDRAFEGSKLSSLTLIGSQNPINNEARSIELGEEVFGYTNNLKSAVIEADINGGMDNFLPAGTFHHSALEECTLPESLTWIGGGAFAYSNLKSFTGWAALEKIDASAFEDCQKLESVDLSNTKVKFINQRLFANDVKLSELKLAERLDYIREYALEGTALKSLIVDASHLDPYAITGMPELESVSFVHPDYQFVLENTLTNLPKLKNIDWGSYVGNLVKNVIVDCPALDSLVTPAAAKYIAKDAFSGIASQVKALYFNSPSLNALEKAEDAPFSAFAARLYFAPSVMNVNAFVFSGMNVTNSPELRSNLAFDEDAFADATIDSLNWHFPNESVYPFKKADVDKLAFSKMTAIPHDLFAYSTIGTLYLDGIEEIGESAFGKASISNSALDGALVIPGSVKSIGSYAFEGVLCDKLIFEQGTGLSIGNNAFKLGEGDGAFWSIRSYYGKDNIPSADGAFSIEDKIAHFYAGSCDDVETYKAADGWKDLPVDKWDGLSEYKYSFEVIGDNGTHPIEFYVNDMIYLNGQIASQGAVTCDNKMKLEFWPFCSDITFDHWPDGSTQQAEYTATLTSDTVIRIYVKENDYDLYLSLENPALSEVAKIYVAQAKDHWEWVEKSEAKVSSCNEASVKLELLDTEHYYFIGWYDEKDKLVSSTSIMENITGAGNLKAKVGINQYYISVMFNPGCMDCYGMEATDHFELNGVNKGNNDFGENLDYGTQVTLKFVGEKGPNYRYVIDYWTDEYGNPVSEENEFTFTVSENRTFHPVIKLANSYFVTAKSADETLGSVTLTPVGDAVAGEGAYWEKSQLELQAIPAGDHIRLKSWNDNAGEESAWQFRTVTVNSNFDYVASFEKDSFNVVITVNNAIDPSMVEFTGEGRYGWGDDVTVSCKILDDHYYFQSWMGPKVYLDEQTATFEDLGSYSDIEIMLYIQPKEYEITLSAEPAEGGTVEGGGKAVYMQLLPITAIPNEGYEFVEWKETGDKNAEVKVEVTGDASYTAVFQLKEYTVTFVDKDGNPLQSGKVQHGKDATAPAAPEVTGYHFTDWDKSYKNITSDLTIKPLYEINTYSVKFFDKDGNQIGETQTVNWNEAAVAPADQVWDGHTFTGWDKSFTNVQSDLDIRPLFDDVYVTVRFVDWDGTQLDAQVIKYGEDATKPADPTRDGYTFTGWDKTFTNVTEDLTVTAQYEKNPDFTPQNLSVTREAVGDDERITLSWDKVDGVPSYEIVLKNGENVLAMSNTFGQNSVAQLLSDVEKAYKLIPGTYTIEWAVRSTDALGNAISGWANGEAFTITVKDPATGLDEVQRNDVQGTKVIKNGVLYIMYNGTMYDVRGQRVK